MIGAWLKVRYFKEHIPAAGEVYAKNNFVEEETFTIFRLRVRITSLSPINH
jgi:hypothetical protein